MIGKLGVSVLFAAVFCASAYADRVVLVNGDRLSGRVIHKSGDTLVLQTAYAGTLKIRAGQVAALTTDRPVAVILSGSEEPVTITIRTDEHGRFFISNAGPGVLLSDIAYINPTPEQTGHGVSYKARANLSAAAARGNSTSDRLYAEAEFSARSKHYRYDLGGKVNYSSESGNQTASNWLLNGNYDWFLDKRLFRYVRGALEHDRFKDIDLRGAVGGGYGLQLVDSDSTKASVRGGLDYVMITRLAGPDDNYPALGWGVRLAHRLGSTAIEFFHEHDGYWNLDNTQEISLRSRTGLRLPVAEGLTASAQLNVDWERHPPLGRKSTDSTLLLGMGYEW